MNRILLVGMCAAVGLGCGPGRTPSDPVWDPLTLPVYRLEFEEADWEDTLAAAFDPTGCEDRAYVKATLTFENPVSGEDEVFEDVGVRYRGHNIYAETERPGFKISFDEFVEERRFHGLEKINLLGTEGDPTLLHERLALQLARSLDIPAPRANHAVLYVNGTFMGVFPNSEEADDSAYIERHFAVDSGSLYKVKGYCGYRAELAYEGDALDPYLLTYEPKAGTDPEDMQADLIPFLQCASTADDVEFRACIETWIDVEEWLREIALDVVMPDVDGMAGAGQNFLLYFDPSIQRFIVYPWDKDLSFFLTTLHPASRDIWEMRPAWLEGSTPQLVDRLRRTYATEYCDAVLLAAERADPKVLAAQIDELEALLGPQIRRDPFLVPEAWRYSLDELVGIIEARQPEMIAAAEACSP